MILLCPEFYIASQRCLATRAKFCTSIIFCMASTFWTGDLHANISLQSMRGDLQRSPLTLANNRYSVMPNSLSFNQLSVMGLSQRSHQHVFDSLKSRASLRCLLL